jgi:predicted GNAT family acetyltransferase
MIGEAELSVTSGMLRVLGPGDAVAALAFAARHPVTNVFIAARVEAAETHGWNLGGQLWGYDVGGELRGLCYSGANLVPATNDVAALRAFAERARRQGRRCSSIVGPSEPVERLWHRLAPTWGAAREVRTQQPLLSVAGPPLTPADPCVRRVRPDELDLLLPACVEMFTEEVGVSPLLHDGGALYRSRVAELIGAGRAFARIENGTVLFKAEVGAVSSSACQVQGVWVHPDHRGQGLSAPGMAAVVTMARATLAPVVSLYVNAHNLPAQRAYERVGFQQVGEFTTVLF